jgi:hypothetical protein
VKSSLPEGNFVRREGEGIKVRGGEGNEGGGRLERFV